MLLYGKLGINIYISAHYIAEIGLNKTNINNNNINNNTLPLRAGSSGILLVVCVADGVEKHW